MAIEYPPYVNAYGKLVDMFSAVRAASVPPKFTQGFIRSVLGLKSSSFRAMIPGQVPEENFWSSLIGRL